MHDLTRTTITSMEAAEWCGKKHNELLKDIRRYISQLEMISEQFGIQLPDDFVKIPEYEQMSMTELLTGSGKD